MDAYARATFGDHYYGNSTTKILENINDITKEDVVEAYNQILTDSKKSLAIVGALEQDSIMPEI